MKLGGLAIATTVALVAAGFVFYRLNQPPTVEVVAAQTRDVQSTLAISGVLESSRRVDIASQLAGARVARVLVDVGSRVRAGDPLIELDASEFEAQLASADASIRQAQAQQDAARVGLANAERSRALALQQEDEVSDLRAQLEVARTNVATAGERLKQAEANRQRVARGGRPETIRQLEVQVERAEATAQQRRQEANRRQALLREGAVSKEFAEQANLAAVTAEADLRVAKENLAQARVPREEDLRQAVAQRDEAQRALDGARRSLAIAEQALRSRLNARSAVVSAENQAATAQASLRSAAAGESLSLAQRRQVQAQLAKTILRAPMDGDVVNRSVEPGQTVSPGTRLLRLANPSVLRVRLDVDEARLGLVRVGQNAVVSPDAFPELRLTARVAEIASAADFGRGTIEVRLDLLDSDPRLRADLTVDANLEVAKFSQVVTVPREAVLDVETTPFCLVSVGGVVTRREVQVERGDAATWVVKSGLQAGDQVIAEPGKVRPGQRVQTKPRVAARP